MLKNQKDIYINASFEFCPTNRLSNYLSGIETGYRKVSKHATFLDWETIWETVTDRIIEIIGSYHSLQLFRNNVTRIPLKLAKGLPGLDWYGHSLLHEVNQGRLSLERLLEVTR